MVYKFKIKQIIQLIQQLNNYYLAPNTNNRNKLEFQKHLNLTRTNNDNAKKNGIAKFNRLWQNLFFMENLHPNHHTL